MSFEATAVIEFIVDKGKEDLEEKPSWPELLNIHLVDEKETLRIIESLNKQVEAQKIVDKKHFTIKLFGSSVKNVLEIA